MRIVKLSIDTNKNNLLQKIGSSKEGFTILKDKMNLNFLYLKDIKNPAALILKQDALSIGADLIVHKDTILCNKDISDALLIANDKQLKILSKKEVSQPFGLKDFAKELKDFIIPKDNENVQIMGVVNINDDSFYSGSRYKGSSAVKKINQMINEGATIIDIGAVSSRPGSSAVSENEEFSRLKPVIDTVYSNNLYKNVEFSLDSYSIKCLEYALDKGFKIVNDITGLSDDKVAKTASRYNAKVVIMHMQGTPENMQKNPYYDNVLLEVSDFFKKRITKAKSFGIDNILLDIGIGFGKKLEHNLTLLKHLEHFKSLGYPLLVGASRKSMIDTITPSKAEQRLPGTLALHLEAVKNGASIIRCHDVKEHFQAFKVQKAIDDTLL